MKTAKIVENFNQALEINCIDEFIQKIHRNFLQYIYNFDDFRLLTKDEIKVNQNALSQILNENEFINFCKTSNGIYYKCCLWAKNNLKLQTLTNKDSLICENHHIECNYMKKYDISENHFNLIDQTYNLVNLTYHMHIFMHTIRYIEYNYEDDLVFLTFIKPDLKKKNFQSKSTSNSWYKATLADFLLEQLAKNPEYFNVTQVVKELKIKAGKKGGIQNALNILDPIINNYLKNEMNWVNIKNKINLMFKPAEFKTLRELVIELNKKIPIEELPNNWTINNSFLTICCTDMKNYLLGTPIIDKRNENNTKYYYSSFYKKQWYLTEANQNSYRLKNIEYVQNQPKPPYSSKQPQQVKNLLYHHNTIWYNTKYETKPVIVSAGEFVNLFDLVYKLLCLLPSKNQPKGFNKFYENPRLKSLIVRELTKVIVQNEDSQKKKTFYGWTYKVIFNQTYEN